MMRTILYRLASILAFAIGLMALFAGGKALVGKLPSWSVLSWLPLYNYSMGLLIVLLAAPLLWRAGKLALPAAMAALGVNAGVLVLLKTAFSGKVAPESLQAMTQRVIIWLVILAIAVIGSRLRSSAPHTRTEKPHLELRERRADE